MLVWYIIKHLSMSAPFFMTITLKQTEYLDCISRSQYKYMQICDNDHVNSLIYKCSGFLASAEADMIVTFCSCWLEIQILKRAEISFVNETFYFNYYAEYNDG